MRSSRWLKKFGRIRWNMKLLHNPGWTPYFHPFGYPIYALENSLRSCKSHNKWIDRSRVGIFLSCSPQNASNTPIVLNTQNGNVSYPFHCVYDNEFDTCKRYAKFKSILQHRAKLVEETVERSKLENLPKKTPDSRNEAILPDTLDPPPMFSTKWENPLTKNYESSDNTKILQSVPTLLTEFELNTHELGHINGTGKKINQVPLLHRLKSVTTALQLQMIFMSQT